MDKEKQAKKMKYYIISGVTTTLLGFIFFMVASGMKDTWEYYVSSDYQKGVDMMSVFAWIFIIWGGVELSIGGLLYAKNDLPESVQPVLSKAKEQEERIEWIEGEIIDKEWNPDQHQVEWITLRQKNGLTVRLWHYIADDKVYKVGDSGLARAKDRLITEFVSGEYVK